MDESLAPYLRCAEKDRLPGIPAISLELRGPGKLWRRTPYLFEVTLRRIDNDNRPCIFSWTPHIDGFTASGFILLHHTPEGLKKIELPVSSLPPLEPWVNEQSSFIEHIPGRVQWWMDVFPDLYLSHLKSGERYTLLWPGRKYATWDWGSAEGHIYSTIKAQDTGLVLPGGPALSFTMEEGEQPSSPAPEAWLMEISSHIQEEEAPILTAKVECPPIVTNQGGEVPTTVHVTYHPSPSGETRPITVHIWRLYYPELYHWCQGIWEDCSPDGCCGFRIVDDPDKQVSPGQHRAFISLCPGETWSSDVNMSLPSNAEVGDTLRCQLTETKIDWWDWGTKEDHLSTRVMLPCWVANDVLEPSDNDGRPLIVVPASNPVDVQIV